MYVPLAGFVAELNENITYKTRYLPVDNKSYDLLLEKLADEDYSFLEIRDGNAIEIVKVVNICDKIMIERGAEQTRPQSFRCGIGVAFVQTMHGIKDTVCQMDNCNDL